MDSSPPSNPFDGFDTYAMVAQQPPHHHQQQQQQQQWPLPPPMAGGTAATTADYNPFASSPAAVDDNPFATTPVDSTMIQQQQHQPAHQPHQAYQPYQQQHQQQLVLATSSVTSPWAMQHQQHQQQMMMTHPAVAAQQLQQHRPHAQMMAHPSSSSSSSWAMSSHQQHHPGVDVVPPPAAGFVDPLDAIFGGGQQMQLHAVQTGPYALPQQQQQIQQQRQQSNETPLLFDFEKTSNGDDDDGNKDASLLANDSEEEGLALIDVELDDDGAVSGGDAMNLEDRRRDGDYLGGDAVRVDDGGPSPNAGGRRQPQQRRGQGARGGGQKQQQRSWDRNPDLAPPPPRNPGRHHAEYLAVNSAPVMSSPLPKYELVHHAGYVLSRISFRTVLMRKWKQTFWIQYGPCQLLFFRSYADYDDWLNNPYHTAKAREYLVKLRVDFVGDLKKSSVMGYQVTQIRRKPYGRNTMLHFKLERWMDYGPTIAAAFAAREEEMINSPTHQRRDGSGDGENEDGFNTVNDVSALRKIILGCMRNARDFALIASRDQRFHQTADSGANAGGGHVGMRGRYDAERDRDARVPASSGNLGYHQAFSAESGERRRLSQMEPGDTSNHGSESSVEETAKASTMPTVASPVVDLLG